MPESRFRPYIVLGRREPQQKRPRRRSKPRMLLMESKSQMVTTPARVCLCAGRLGLNSARRREVRLTQMSVVPKDLVPYRPKGPSRYRANSTGSASTERGLRVRFRSDTRDAAVLVPERAVKASQNSRDFKHLVACRRRGKRSLHHKLSLALAASPPPNALATELAIRRTGEPTGLC